MTYSINSEYSIRPVYYLSSIAITSCIKNVSVCIFKWNKVGVEKSGKRRMLLKLKVNKDGSRIPTLANAEYFQNRFKFTHIFSLNINVMWYINRSHMPKSIGLSDFVVNHRKKERKIATIDDSYIRDLLCR